jgi:CheY-like chemotaxis protein
VTTAGSGEEGIEIAKVERPDAILLDWMMPGLDGPAALERLRADPATREIPVVMLTAKVQATDRRRLLDLGVDAVLPKPFEPMHLAEEPAEALGWQQ